MGCVVGIITGIMLIAHGYINVGGENSAYATVAICFGATLIVFCGVLQRCKINELSQKFGAAENTEIYLQCLDPNLIEAEWRRYHKLLAKASLLKGGYDAD